VILGDQHHCRLDHAQSAAPFSQELLPEDVCAADGTTAVSFQHIVPVHGLCQINSQPVHVHLVDEEGGAADELLAHMLLPEARRPAGGAIEEIAVVGGSVV